MSKQQLNPTLFKHPQWVKVFENTGFGDEFEPIVGFSTTCCALLILSIKEYHSLEQIKSVIDWVKRDSNSKNWTPDNRMGGERNFQVVISPGENELRKNLIKLGFHKMASNLPRRRGYPGGTLEFYLLSF